MFPGYFLWRMFSRFARAYLPILFNFAFIEASSMLYIEIFLRWFTTTFLELFCINRLRNWLIVFHLLFLFLLLLVIYFIYIMCIPFSKFLVISASEISKCETHKNLSNVQILSNCVFWSLINENLLIRSL